MPELPGTTPTTLPLPTLSIPGVQNASPETLAWLLNRNAAAIAQVTVVEAIGFVSANIDAFLAWKAASVSGMFQVVPPKP